VEGKETGNKERGGGEMRSKLGEGGRRRGMKERKDEGKKGKERKKRDHERGE